MYEHIGHNGQQVNPPVPIDIIDLVPPVEASRPMQPCELKGLTKAQRAAYAADVVDGRRRLQFDAEVAAKTFEVSVTSINRARRLLPEQRDLVKQLKRKLVEIKPEPRERRFAALVDEIGLAGIHELLALFEDDEVEVAA